MKPAAIERIAVAGWIALELLKAAQLVWAGGVRAADYIVIAAMAVLLANTIRRPAPLSYRVDWQTLLPCLVSISVTTAAFAFSPEQGARTLFTDALELISAAFMLWAALSLGKSFTMLPAAISPVQRGAYGLVRHPLYAAYLIYDIALGLQFAAWLVWLAITCEAVAFAVRASQEEKLLRQQFPDYAAYQARVRGRFIPYLL